MDIFKVIYLGHKAKQPLIGLPSELADGLEPHGLFGSSLAPVPTADSAVAGRGCTRGGAVAGWVPGGYYTGYTQPTRLRLI